MSECRTSDWLKGDQGEDKGGDEVMVKGVCVCVCKLAGSGGRMEQKGTRKVCSRRKTLCLRTNSNKVQVTQHCTFTQHLRDTHFSNISDLFSDNYDDAER